MRVVPEHQLDEAVRLLESFGVGAGLTSRIGLLEASAAGLSVDGVVRWLGDEKIDDQLWEGARAIKGIAAQINTVIHAVGMLIALPHILGDGEVVERLSLGAGNTGRDHDLETNRQIAEFKFIDWRGGVETVRQNGVFYDVYALARAETEKRRVLYLLGTDQALKFLQGRRSLASVLSRNAGVAQAFNAAHGAEAYRTVSAYWKSVEHLVEIQNLRELVPSLA